jgi:hypothetical protein
MKIELKPGYIAVLQEQSGAIVASLSARDDARNAMERAVNDHFGCDSFLLTDKDFTQPLDYSSEYKFNLYKQDPNGDDDRFITLLLTYTPIY